jgi:hypothetical protein
VPSALLKFTNNMTAPSVLTLVEGNTLKLKLEGIPKAYVLKTLVDQTPIVTTGDTKHNARADSWQFEFIAKQAGLARISIISSQGSSALSISPSAITIRVEAAMKLPPLDTEEGMLVRLLLAESRSPEKMGSATAEEVKKGMQWMRRVIVNRLRSDKPEEFMARGASGIVDIVKADDQGSVQFHGFNQYPRLEEGIAKNLDDSLSIANDGTHPKRAAYAQFVQSAIDVANEALPMDPSPNGLFAWRTRRATSPSAEFKLFAMAAGNDFYTHTRLKKKD